MADTDLRRLFEELSSSVWPYYISGFRKSTIMENFKADKQVVSSSRLPPACTRYPSNHPGHQCRLVIARSPRRSSHELAKGGR